MQPVLAGTGGWEIVMRQTRERGERVLLRKTGIVPTPRAMLGRAPVAGT